MHTENYPQFGTVAVSGLIGHWPSSHWHSHSPSTRTVSSPFDDGVYFDFDLLGTHLRRDLLENLPFFRLLSTIEQPGTDSSTILHQKTALLTTA